MLMISVGLTLAFVIGETAAGFWSNSLALLSDAGHNFADAVALLLTAYGLWITKKPANAEKTYGYHRAGIMAALVNAASLVVIAGFIAWEAVERLRRPEAVAAGPMMTVAAAAIFYNGLIAYWLHAGAKHDLNVRSAYLHMVGDAAAALGVVIAGAIVWLTGATAADPLVSLVIAALILWSSWGVLREAVNILLEGAPAGLDMAAVTVAIRGVPGVLGLHDLHVWTVGPGVVACSCHIVVAEQSIRDGQQVLRAVVHKLGHDFAINHTTIQVEVEGCGPDELYCTLQAGHAH